MIYTFKGLFTLLHIERDKLYKLIADGEITGFRIGSTWRFFIDRQTEIAKKRCNALRSYPAR